MKKKIVLFASGSGTNVENIIRYFENNQQVDVVGVYCNRKGAGVLERAKKASVPCRLFDKTSFTDGSLLAEVNQASPDLIVLAGFLWLVPVDWVRAFPKAIINIHPALLPSYGGKGMYGDRVHQAVIQNGEKESGITIHYVNENYDEGENIFQAKCSVLPKDDADLLAKKIHELEHRYFPEILLKLLNNEA